MMLSRRQALAGMTGALPLLTGAATDDYRIDPQPVGDGLWMIHGADEPMLFVNGGAIANIVIIATPAGTLLVDAGPSVRYGHMLRKVAETLTGQPVVRVYVTHLHPDHV